MENLFKKSYYEKVFKWWFSWQDIHKKKSYIRENKKNEGVKW
jgi:hypothetical protein